MARRLTDFIDPRTLHITLADIAQAVQKPAEKLYHPQKCEWKWAYLFLIVVEGEGGQFGSYRALLCWLEAVIELLTNCNDAQTLAELIKATVAELQHYTYPDSHKQRLQEVLEEQKARLEDLTAKATGSIKAWEWAKGWERVIKMCPSAESLNMAVPLFKLQRVQFAAYPEVIEWVRDVGRQHREFLQCF
jgi:hypothetical protein